MNEPLRLRDPRSQASPELRALLAIAEPPSPLPAAARERVRRALTIRSATSERRAVCWSHALGCALALATCFAWLLSPRAPDTHPSIARAPAAFAPAAVPVAGPDREPAPREPAPPAHVDRRAAIEAVVVAEARPGRAVRRPARAVAEGNAIARRAVQGRRSATGSERSRDRIEALVDGILKPDAQLLDRARREASRDPEQALALIDAYRRSHPDSPLPAPAVVAEVDALRRLGRFDEALARARELLESSRKAYYADEMAERFAFLDL